MDEVWEGHCSASLEPTRAPRALGGLRVIDDACPARRDGGPHVCTIVVPLHRGGHRCACGLAW